MRKKIRVICDTNIWYGFVRGYINKDDIPKNITLVGTLFSMHEIINTPKLLKDIELVRDTARSLFNDSDEIIFYHAMEYLKHLDDSLYMINPMEHHKKTINTAEVIANGLIIDPRDNEKVRNFIYSRKNKPNSAAERMNDFIKEKVKPLIKNNADKDKHRKRIIENQERTREVINSYIKYYSKSDGVKESFNWASIELLMNVFQEFFIQLDTTGRTVKGNDWIDLFNMAYVQKGDLYWTLEKRWINLAKQANMEHYLFRI